MLSSPPTEAPAAAFVCGCDERVRSACERLPFYKEHEGKRYCVLHYPGKDKVAAFNEMLKKKRDDRNFNFSGIWFPDCVDFSGFTFATPVVFDYATFSAGANFNGATFSAEADFSHAKFDSIAYFLYTKFAKVSFDYAMFSAEALFGSAMFSAEAHFSHAKFEALAFFQLAEFSAEASFSSATFGAGVNFSATFSAEVSFDYATFSAEVDFYSARFGKLAFFDHATFGANADFFSATFGADADFSFAKFSAGAFFDSITFSKEANFNYANFKDYARFAEDEEKVFGDDSSLNLELTRIEKPDHLSFRKVTLRPHWFINVNARKFEFIDVNWDWQHISVKKEVESISKGDVLSKLQLLAIACQNLAANAEENDQYDDASNFRYMAMEARRLERWHGFAFWTLGWWYWLASGYGERVWQAFVVLVGVWLVAAALYTRVGVGRWGPGVLTEGGGE